VCVGGYGDGTLGGEETFQFDPIRNGSGGELSQARQGVRQRNALTLWDK
jgi:hypothetical protein